MSILASEASLELHDGAKLTLEAFHQAYLEYPDHTRFELVEGIARMASPVYSDQVLVHKVISYLGTTYDLSTPGVQFLAETSIRMGENNEFRPDGAMRVTDEFSGSCRLAENRLFEGPPELVIEVAGSSLNFDLNLKRRVYARHGVEEYIVIDLANQTFYWFDFRSGEQRVPDADGVCRSRLFPGFWLSIPSVLGQDIAGALPALQNGLASAEHKTFVEELARRRVSSQNQ